jgi:hypothetical protein
VGEAFKEALGGWWVVPGQERAEHNCGERGVHGVGNTDWNRPRRVASVIELTR